MTLADKKARRRAQDSLWYLARYILQKEEEDFLIERFHKPICDFVQDLTIHRRQLEMPRGFLKTTICSRAKPIWLTIRDLPKSANERILLANMIYDNAAKNVHVIRQHWEKNRKLRTLFPELVPKTKGKGWDKSLRWSDACAELPRSGNYDVGTYEAVGVGGSKIGAHYTHVIEDDLVAARKDVLTAKEILPNQEDMDKAIGWHKLAVNLLVNPKKDYIDNVGTRWGQYDLIRHIADNQPYYKRFVQAAVLLDDKGNAVLDGDGNEIPVYPERFPNDVLKEIRGEQGDFIYSMMYLGKPYNVADMIFQDSWIKTFEGEAPEGNIYAGLDAAFAKGPQADYSAIVIPKVTSALEMYMLHYVREKMNPTEIIKKVFELFDTWHFKWLAVEKTTYEQTLGHYIRLENKRRVYELSKPALVIKQVSRPKGESKAMHIRALQPICMAGKVYIRPWMSAIRTEMTEFTGRRGDRDDLLDAWADVFALVHYPAKSVVEPKFDPFSVDAVIKELVKAEGYKKGYSVREY